MSKLNSNSKDERRNAIIDLVSILRTGNLENVKQLLTGAEDHAAILFAEMDWPEMVAETAAKSSGEIQMRLLKHLEKCGGSINEESKARILSIIADLLDNKDHQVANAALDVFKKHGARFHLNQNSPKRCLISWLMICPNGPGATKSAQ